MFFAYCRVSTLEQAAHNRSSLREQERVCRGVAMTRGVPNLEISVYSDPGVSGTIPLADRPAGGRLLADAQRGDVVCASKLDRMFRDALDAQQTYRTFKKAGVDLILFDLGADPITSGGVSKLIFTVLSAVADMERERIAERMQTGKAARLAAGGWPNGHCPYGYRVEGHGRSNKLVKDDTEQAALALADATFKAHASEIGQYGKVARALREAGFRSRSGEPFQVVQVQRILERERQ